MKIALVAFLLAVPAFAQGTSASRPRAAACGPKGVSFAVTRVDSSKAPAAPQPGNATVYFIQDDGPGGNRQHYTLKIGLDGAWVGAYKNNSYFAVPVGPGEHHVCANVQSNTSARHNLALAHFTAKPGMVYYFRTRFLAGLTTEYPVYPYLELDRPDSDQAEYLIASYPVSVSQPKK